MKNISKKVLAAVLAMVLVIGVFAITAAAAGTAADIVKVAQAQVGKNHTTYTSWYGFADEWCAMFVSWCARQAVVDTSVIKNSAVACANASYFNVPFVERDKRTPAPGDLIFFKNSIGAWAHVGIVESYDAAKGIVHTIEGNTGGTKYSNSSVNKYQYSKTYSNIQGYGVPAYKGTTTTTTTTTSAPAITTANLTYRVTSSAGVNVRGTASASGAVTGALGYNGVFVIDATTTADGYTWGRIKSVSNYGTGGSCASPAGKWVALNFCEKVATTATTTAAPASTLAISAVTAPSGTLTKDKAFVIRATIKSNYTITNVTASITGTTSMSKSVNPNSTSYTIGGETIDNGITFNTLPAGSYTYTVKATDSSGKTVTSASYSFKIAAAADPAYRVTSTNGVNVRKTASTSGAVAGALGYNGVYTVTGETKTADGYTWDKIKSVSNVGTGGSAASALVGNWVVRAYSVKV